MHLFGMSHYLSMSRTGPKILLENWLPGSNWELSGLFSRFGIPLTRCSEQWIYYSKTSFLSLLWLADTMP
jgi:hypothetical protein